MRQYTPNETSAQCRGVCTEASSTRRVRGSKRRHLDPVDGGGGGDCVPVDSEATEPGTGLDRLLCHVHAVDHNELGDLDILEMLFFLASRSDQSHETAMRALEMYGSLAGVLHAPAGELHEITGFDPKIAGTLSVVTLAMKRALAEKMPDVVALGSLAELEAYLALDVRRGMKPEIRVLFLDRKNRLIRDESYDCGDAGDLSRIKQKVAHDAVMARASGAIMVSRDASSDPRPSRADVQVTVSMRDALESLCVTLHDHVICGLGRCFSMKKKALV